MNKDKETKNKLAVKLKRRILGYGCLILGVIGGFLPILQGWVFIALGLLLLKDHSRWARRAFLWVYKKFPKSRKAFKKAESMVDRVLEKFGLAEKGKGKRKQ